MSESDETFKRLGRMEQDLADIQSMTRSLLRAQGNERSSEILKALEADDALRKVYLLVDGVRGQSDITDKLKGSVSGSTVNRKLDDLVHEYELIVFVTRRNPGGNVYRRSLTDDVLKIGRKIKK